MDNEAFRASRAAHEGLTALGALDGLREIAAGNVHFDRPGTDAIADWIHQTHGAQEREDNK